MTNWKINTPVAFVIFNRPDTTARVFEAIRQAQPPKLFVIADGPRPDKPGEEEQCAAARAVIDRVDWKCEVFKNYSNINLGGRKRQVTGYNFLFELVDEAIILEDDCLPHPSFFGFCEELLNRYRNNEQIMSISGDNFQFGRRKISESYYFSRYFHTWGWATWKRAWNCYDDQLSHWPDFWRSGRLHEILNNNLKAVEYWYNIFQSRYTGKYQNGWDYRFILTAWAENGMHILPSINLVSNIGFGERASNLTNPNSIFANIPALKMDFPLVHPSQIISNSQLDDSTENIVFSGMTGAKIDLQYAKAIVLGRSKQYHRAVQILKKVLSANPYHPKASMLQNELESRWAESLLVQAKGELSKSQPAQAFQYLNQAKSLHRPVLSLDFLRAICFLKDNQIRAAKEALQEELRYFPHNQEALQLLQKIQQKSPNIDTAKIQNPEFQEILKVIRLNHPLNIVQNIEADKFTQQYIFDGGGYKIPKLNVKALGFEEKTKPNPALMQLVNQGITQINLGRHNAALQILETAIQTNPSFNEVNYPKAIALARLGKTQKAIKALEILLSNFPEHQKGKQLLQELQSQQLHSQPHSAPSTNISKLSYLNLGCGHHFHRDWVNVDFISTGSEVLAHDLRKSFPFPNESFHVVYHSHVLEHFSKNQAKFFLEECYRILKNNGIIRVVVPDLEQIAKLYLTSLEKARQGSAEWSANYDWILLEMYDQVVRNHSGGDMAAYLMQQPIPNESFVLERTGVQGEQMIQYFRQFGCRPPTNLELTPEQIGMFRCRGEVHQWMYDSYSLSRLLKNIGFRDIKVQSAWDSDIPDFKQYHLDIMPDNRIRIGGSLFIEALK